MEDAQQIYGRAVQELAHAVACHRLGFRIDHVQFDPPKVVLPSEDVVEASEQSVRDLHCMAVVCLAGPVATSRLTGPPMDDVLKDVGADDAEKLRVLVDASPEGRRSSFRRDAVAAAEAMVQSNWDAILRIAPDRQVAEAARGAAEVGATRATGHQVGSEGPMIREPMGFLVG
jgi:hypothetical protein